MRLCLSRQWVDRRIETFTFVDADTVRRRMSVDLTLPRSPHMEAAGERLALVPLMTLVKRDLRHLDVVGPEGAPLPVLNTEQNGEAMVIGLAATLAGLVADLPEAGPDRQVDVDLLRRIVTSRDSGGAMAEQEIRPGGALDAQLRHAEPEQAAQLAGFIRTLERHFVLLVPLTYRPGRRQLCKLAYDAAIGVQRATFVAGNYSHANRLASSLGPAGRVEVFDDLPVGLGQSYHVERPPTRTWVGRP